VALLDDLFDYLTFKGAGDPPWRISKSFQDDDSDLLITVCEYPGAPADTLGRENERPKFQVYVRASRLDYATARAKWDQVYGYLQDAQDDGAGHLTGYAYIQSLAGGSPFPRQDDKGRWCLSTNFQVCKARA